MQALFIIFSIILFYVASDMRRYTDSKIKVFSTDFIIQFAMIAVGISLCFISGKYF